MGSEMCIRDRAWGLAGDEARRSGRLEVAAERYRKGLEVKPEDLPLTLGLAQVELANGRLETARETIDKVLAVAAKDLTAVLLAAELDLAQRQQDAARKRLDEVRAAKPTHPMHKAQLALLSGRLLELSSDSAGALALYREAITSAGEADLAPTMAAVSLLTHLADQSKDEAEAAAQRAEVEALLLPLTKRASQDSSVAVTLGAAYLAAGNATKAEEWLTAAVAQRPDDLDARLQLAKAARKLGRLQQAIELLQAGFTTAPTRAGSTRLRRPRAPAPGSLRPAWRLARSRPCAPRSARRARAVRWRPPRGPAAVRTAHRRP